MDILRSIAAFTSPVGVESPTYLCIPLPVPIPGIPTNK